MNGEGKLTIGLILAGGQARRMGGADKAFVMLGGRTLVENAIERARSQAGEILINANGDLSRFVKFGREILPDRIGGFLGPLAGILTGHEWMKEHRPKARWLASIPCDTPFLPLDMVERLIGEAERVHALTAVASSGGRRHNVCAVWSASIAETASTVLNERGLRKMDDFIDSLPHVEVAFDAGPVDPFFNINTADDLARAGDLMAKTQALR